MSHELRWNHPIEDIPEQGLAMQRTASPEELAAIARLLDLRACERLTSSYAIAPLGSDRYRLSGTFSARVRQSCVVTLEPISSDLADSFDVEFWPAQDMPEPVNGVVDLEDEAYPEPITAGQIDVGRIVFECLAGAIDPYPRAAGAALDWKPPTPAGEEAESPFAVLARIKKKG